MIYLLLAVSGEPADVKSYEVMRVPAAFDQRSAKVCGAIRRLRSEGIPYIIEAGGPLGMKGLLVDARMVDASKVASGETTCIKGVVRRVDGLSEKEAIAAGKTYVLEDTGIDPAYYLTRR